MRRLLSYCVWGCLVPVFVLMGGTAQTLRAQETLQNSTVFGTITDATGAAVAGANVEVTSPAMQGSRVATTNGDGAYRIPDLPAGTYRVAYSKEGFQTDVRTDFTLNAGFAARVDVALKVGSMTQTVEVSGQAPVIDTSTTVTSSTLTRNTLDDVPTTRSIYQAVYMAPGIRPSATPDIGGSQLGTQQSMGSFGFSGNTIQLVDGMNVLQGNSLNAGGSSGDFVDFDSLEELKVVPAGADADVGPPGTLIVTVMKTGGNQLHGDGRGMGEWQGFQRTNLPSTFTCVKVGSALVPCPTNSNQLQELYDIFGDVGGKIIRDKLWFYGGVHFQRRSLGVIGYIGPDGGQGYDPIKQDNQEGKLTYQFTKNIKINGSFTDSTKYESQRNGSSTVPFASTWRFFDNYWTIKGELTWTLTPQILIDVMGGRYWQPGGYPSQAGYDVAGNPWTVNSTTGLSSGAVRNVTSGDNGTHNRTQYSGSVSYFPTGKHSFQFGTTIFAPQFDERDNYNHADPYQLQVTTVAGVITPSQILTYNIPQNSIGKEQAIGIYAKDIWRVTNRLTLNPGIRFDRYKLYHDAEPEPGGQFYAATTFPAQVDFIWNRVAPRIGAAYDLQGNGKTVIRASYGQYNIDELGQFDVNQYNPGAIITTTYKWTGPCVVTSFTVCDASAATLATLGTGTTSLTSIAGGVTGIINPNLKEPYMQTVTAAVEREVTAGWAVRALFVYQSENNMFGQTFPNRPISAYNQPFNTTYPATDPINGGKPITILFYPNADKCAATNPVCSFNQTLLVNRTGDADHFQTIEFTMTKRKSHKWSASGAIDVTKDHKWLNTASIVSSTDFSTAQPSAPYQAAFPLDTTWDYAFKGYFTYDLPFHVGLGLNYEYLAGTPNYATDQFTGVTNLGTVTIPLEPFGTRRTPAISLLNIRIAKIIALGEHRSLTATLELYNALNASPGTSVNYQYGALNTAKQFGQASVILPPMIGRLGLQYTF